MTSVSSPCDYGKPVFLIRLRARGRRVWLTGVLPASVARPRVGGGDQEALTVKGPQGWAQRTSLFEGEGRAAGWGQPLGSGKRQIQQKRLQPGGDSNTHNNDRANLLGPGHVTDDVLNALPVLSYPFSDPRR